MTLTSYLFLKLLFLSHLAQPSAFEVFARFPPAVVYDKSTLADDYVSDDHPTLVNIVLTPLELYYVLNLLENDRRDRFDGYLVDISSPIIHRLCEPLDASRYRDSGLVWSIQRCKRGSW